MERNGEWHGAKKEHSKCTTTRKMTGGEKKPDSSKATTAKIIELFETEPSFSGVSGVVDSGKSTYVNKDLV